ncbi:hypothetical protein ACT543_12340, partial [Lactiplantibacillus plantarum]|uniref:hypothetical protein n=1 Tax=Lactiplantibacillus plantarum TaxID=1590 RepID=UPI0040374B37
KAGLEKSEDFSRPALFLETYVTASFLHKKVTKPNWSSDAQFSLLHDRPNLLTPNAPLVKRGINANPH